MLTLAGVIGIGGAFGMSALHPGPQGKAGRTGAAGAAGAQGLQGLIGPAGLTGSAAQVTNLGVCYSATNQFNSFTNSSWVSSVFLISPSKHADGTTYCPTGQYVPVSPQSYPNGN
jgi:hypothetical protein